MAMFTAQEKKNLKQLIAIAAKKENVSSLNGLHGFLFGLAIIPVTFLPNEWITEIIDVGKLEVCVAREKSLVWSEVF